jgi:hypothetical protein
MGPVGDACARCRFAVEGHCLASEKMERLKLWPVKGEREAARYIRTDECRRDMSPGGMLFRLVPKGKMLTPNMDADDGDWFPARRYVDLAGAPDNMQIMCIAALDGDEIDEISIWVRFGKRSKPLKCGTTEALIIPDALTLYIGASAALYRFASLLNEKYF